MGINKAKNDPKKVNDNYEESTDMLSPTHFIKDRNSPNNAD